MHRFASWSGGAFHRRFVGMAVAAGMAASAWAAADVDLEITGKVPDAFDKSIFKLYLPNNAKQVRSVIVFRTGYFGDLEPEWRDLASRTKSALVWYSSFTGKGTADQIARMPEGKRPVETGQALLEALSQYAARLRRPELAEAPIVLWSFEGEVNFTMRFLKANPDRVLALVAAHPRCGDGIGADLGDDALKVPALLIHRGCDSPTWIAALKVLVDRAREKGAPWCSTILHADRPGHLGCSSDFAIPYVESCIKLRTADAPVSRAPGRPRAALKPLDLETGWLVDATAHQAQPAAAVKQGRESLGWLPDERCVNKWKEGTQVRHGK